MSAHPTARPKTIGLDEARTALTELAPKLKNLLGSIRDPKAAAVGEWSIGETAAHLSHVAMVEVAAVRGGVQEALSSLGMRVPRDIADVAALNAAALDEDPERDPAVLADRLEASIDDLIGACEGDDRSVRWLLGVELPMSAVCSHFVSEIAIHGRDIARASKTPWRIDPVHATIAIEGFYLPILSSIGKARADEPAGASCEMRLRGGNRWVIAETASGIVVEPPGRTVDLRISAYPVALLLLMSGRTGPVPQVLSGRMAAWGRHPVRAKRMLDRMAAP